MIKLDKEEYKKLCLAVLKRDKFKCRYCLSRESLSCHHIIKRSKERIDADWNLITLCFKCHYLIENKMLFLIGDNANLEVKFCKKILKVN